MLTTLRKGVTKLEVAGYTPSAFVLHPNDWEGVELALTSAAAIEHLRLPYDPATRRLFGVPVTTTNAQAAGVGHVLARTQSRWTPTPAVWMSSGRRTRPQTGSGRTWCSLGANLVTRQAL